MAEYFLGAFDNEPINIYHLRVLKFGHKRANYRLKILYLWPEIDNLRA